MPLPNREGMVSSSGRILKGRGNMKYRTPPPSEVDNKSSTHIYIIYIQYDCISTLQYTLVNTNTDKEMCP